MIPQSKRSRVASAPGSTDPAARSKLGASAYAGLRRDRKVTRLRFLRPFLCALAFCLAALQPIQADTPNVLLIMIDDLNDWVAPYGGHPQAITPHLDQFAAEGITFSNAHTAAPACNPSRTAMLTGVAPHRSGIYQNWAHMRDSPVLADAMTLPAFLRERDYFTVGGGKVFHAPNRRPEIWNSEPHAWDDYFSGIEGETFFLPPEGTKHISPKGVGKFDWHPIASDEAEPLDEQVVRWAEATLADMPQEQPFFMAAGILKPHLPLYAPKRFFDLYPLDEIKMPPILEGDRTDIPSHAGGLDAFLVYDYDDTLRENNARREAVRAYLACVSYIDDCVGRILAALEASGLADDTLVLVVSDHGFHLGEKAHWGKFSLWEESTRSPLLMRGPGVVEGAEVNAAVSLLDIYPTLLDYLNLPPLRQLDGLSLMPLVRNPEIRWDQPVLTTSGRNNHSVRSNQYRYIRYSNGTEELYDHAADPNEWTNLAKDPELAAIKAKLEALLPVYNAEEVF